MHEYLLLQRGHSAQTRLIHQKDDTSTQAFLGEATLLDQVYWFGMALLILALPESPLALAACKMCEAMALHFS